MDKHKHTHFEIGGMDKQVILNEHAIPTRQATRRSGDMQWDNETLRVFVDASELNEQGIFGLAGCFVGQGEVFTRMKKHYNLKFKGQNPYAECMAILFVIQILPSVIKKKYTKPKKIFIFSDLVQFDWFDKVETPFHDVEMNQIIIQIRDNLKAIGNLFPDIQFNVRYMSNTLKRHNPFYRAAHNAARRAIQINR